VISQFYDTHAHLDFKDFNEDISEVVERATAAGISRIITIGTTLEKSARAIEIADRFPSVYAAVGVHPGHVNESPEEIREALLQLASHPKVVAIGEIGLDFFRRPSDSLPDPELETINRRRQHSLFRQQLEVASVAGLNVIIHTRDSFNPTMEVFRPYADRVRGVFHCWVGTVEEMKEVTALGSLVSFTGIATFKNGENVRASIAAAAAGSFMLETDCPFLAPMPHRGKRCEPAYIAGMAPMIAAVRSETVETLSLDTCRTARLFFPRMG
jgi:TatD DNase family protein